MCLMAHVTYLDYLKEVIIKILKEILRGKNRTEGKLVSSAPPSGYGGILCWKLPVSVLGGTAEAALTYSFLPARFGTYCTKMPVRNH